MVVTDNKDLNAAVETMKLGAFDYIVKPIDRVLLISNIERAIEMHTIVHKIDRLRGEMQKTHVYKNIVGQSEKIQHVFDQINAATRAIALIAQHRISRTSRKTETAMNALSKVFLHHLDERIGALICCEFSFHMPSYMRPGLSTPSGSKLSLSVLDRRLSSAD